MSMSLCRSVRVLSFHMHSHAHRIYHRISFASPNIFRLPSGSMLYSKKKLLKGLKERDAKRFDLSNMPPYNTTYVDLGTANRRNFCTVAPWLLTGTFALYHVVRGETYQYPSRIVRRDLHEPIDERRKLGAVRLFFVITLPPPLDHPHLRRVSIIILSSLVYWGYPRRLRERELWEPARIYASRRRPSLAPRLYIPLSSSIMHPYHHSERILEVELGLLVPSS